MISVYLLLDLFGSTEGGINGTNKTYGTDGNDMMMEVVILTKIAFYVLLTIIFIIMQISDKK